jgi:hypothetical protein
MSSYGEEYGALKTKTHRAKWVDEWTFYSPARGMEPYKVRVRLRNEYGKGLSFTAICEQLRPPPSDSDINKLYKRVEEMLRRQDIVRTDIKWEEWLEIEVQDEPHSWRGEDYSGFAIVVRTLKRGIHTESGQAYTINNNNIVVPFPKPKRAGEEDKNHDDEKWFQSREERHQFSYIPATPANKAALKSLAERLQELHGRLCGLLAQSEIQAALMRETTLRLESK